MSLLEKSRCLFVPPFSGGVETFICPIPKYKYELTNGSRIAGGWKFFNELKNIKKKDNSYCEVIMSIAKLLRTAKMESKKNLQKVEKNIDSIIEKRQPLSKLDMSKPHIMGIINLTPDSFYKNSQLQNSSLIVQKSIKMISEGASILDLGGESTRPGAKKISVNQEIRRVIPSIINLKKVHSKACLSLDTRNLSTMQEGFKQGVDIINDISGFEDKEKIKFVSESKLPIIVMHMQNQPENMQAKPDYNFAPIDIYKMLNRRINCLLELGVEKSNIVIDPGIGFGKNKIHNIDIIKNLTLFHTLGVPILLGLSRKSLIEEITIDKFKLGGINKKSVPPTKRLSGSIAFAMHAYNNGIQFIRTHDVFQTKQAISCQEALD